jgi:hypothetical protein
VLWSFAAIGTEDLACIRLQFNQPTAFKLFAGMLSDPLRGLQELSLILRLFLGFH